MHIRLAHLHSCTTAHLDTCTNANLHTVQLAHSDTCPHSTILVPVPASHLSLRTRVPFPFPLLRAFLSLPLRHSVLHCHHSSLSRSLVYWLRAIFLCFCGEILCCVLSLGDWIPVSRWKAVSVLTEGHLGLGLSVEKENASGIEAADLISLETIESSLVSCTKD